METWVRVMSGVAVGIAEMAAFVFRCMAIAFAFIALYEGVKALWRQSMKRWLIRSLEAAIKRRGLWQEYATALGFRAPSGVPEAQEVLWGVPLRRRVWAAWRVWRGCI